MNTFIYSDTINIATIYIHAGDDVVQAISLSNCINVLYIVSVPKFHIYARSSITLGQQDHIMCLMILESITG